MLSGFELSELYPRWVPLPYGKVTEVRGENDNPWEGDGEGGGRNFSLIPQVSMARNRRTNNPSASTFTHIKNRLVISLVNLRSWHKHPHGLSESPTFGRGVEGRLFMSRVYFCNDHFFTFFPGFLSERGDRGTQRGYSSKPPNIALLNVFY